MSTLDFAPMTDPQIFAEADRFVASLIPEPLAPETSAQTWAGMTEMGWPLCLLPEEAGGLGADLATVAAIVEGAARHAPAAPLVAGCAVVPWLLSAAPADLREAATAGIADNSWRIAYSRPVFSAALRGGETVVTPFGHDAPTHVLLALEAPAELVLVDLSAAGVSHSVSRSLDGRCSLQLSLSGEALAQGRRLAEGDAAARLIAAAEDLGAGLTALEIVSLAGVALKRTAEYLGEREQFGAKLASFQVLRQRFAAVYADYLNARALCFTLFNQNLLENAEAAPQRQVALAYLLAVRQAHQIAQQVIQFHGGIGVTEELGVSRLNRRLLAAAYDFGSADDAVEQLIAAA